MKTNEQTTHASILANRANQVQRGGARAAVLGVNDGLVSTLCIVLGVAAATNGDQHPVLIAGFAGLVAGAISMGIGEWISVRSQVELFEGVLTDVQKLIREDKPLIEQQLQDNLVGAGVTPRTAQTTTQDIAHDDRHLFDLYVSRVIGINKDELGSPWIAAFSSAALFTAGALASLLPWFLSHGTLAIVLSCCFTLVGALLVGGYVARSSGRSIVKGGVRQLAMVVVAAIVTYGIGHLFGTVIN